MKIKIRSTFAVGATSHMGNESPKQGEFNLDIKEGTTVGDLLESLPSLGPSHQFDDIMIHVFVNGTLKGFDHILQDGDILDIHIPVSGG